ncbi:thioredoxin-like protein 1 [Leptotrombidium deliense]|uniref:Thioredoxin-like protein 1 n=1 Tax=Leptotrombidium deliense TaxID=299467 RepID=A0A443SGY3_9ACAR|nr:thioredoxin-like protein 1 [Leptotrombidium deliense]
MFLSVVFCFPVLLTLFCCLIITCECVQRKPALHSDLIEEVDTKKLDSLLEEEEYIAVFFYTRSCEECKEILEELEKIDDEADDYGVSFVKISERAAAKKHGVTEFPSLVYFKNKEPSIYEGDLMNEEQVLDWLTSIESMDLPDKIEEVNSKNLQNVIDDHDYVAVLVCYA